MPPFLEKVGSAIEKCDWFASPILLRYEMDENKASKTGGFFSIILIVLLTVAFYKSWLTVLEKQNVRSDMSLVRQMDPSEITLTEEDFILAITFNGLNISKNEDRYFDLSASYKIKKYASQSENHQIDLIPCPKQRFSKFGQQFSKFYDNLNLQNGLCFPENFSAKLEGKFTSKSFQYIKIEITRCSGQKCKSEEQFQTYLENREAFYLNFYFVNKLFNPSEINPILNYVEDKYFFMISKHHSFDVNMFVGQYEINTDEGLYPWREDNITKGYFVQTTKTQERTNTQTGEVFGKFYFRKSDQKVSIHRDFRKIDDLLSYLGGLLGLIVTVCGIFMTHYNQCCFQLQMCNKVFKSEQQVSQKSNASDDDPLANTFQNEEQEEEKNDGYESFNFFVYAKYLFSCIIFSICPSFKWKRMKKLEEKLEQTRSQMNIDILLQKISFYERALQCLFTQEQIILLCCQQKLSIKQLRDQRMLFNLKKIEEQINLTEPGSMKKHNSLKKTIKPENMAKTMQNMCSQTFIQQLETNEGLKSQLFSAIHRVSREAQEGNQICERILDGLRDQVITTYKNKTKDRLPSIRSKISKIQSCPRDYQINIQSVKEHESSHSLNKFPNLIVPSEIFHDPIRQSYSSNDY